jgi:hypothetical protein
LTSETLSTSSAFDACIVFSQETGAKQAHVLFSNLSDQGVSAVGLACLATGIPKLLQLELIYKCYKVIAFLTDKFLENEDALRLLEHAVNNDKTIILVHDPLSCIFPAPSTQPSFLAETFAAKAITYFEQYIDSGAAQIAKKLVRAELKPENISTRGFLSHKRTTAQGIAGRLYQALHQEYNLFLDTEATFDLHNLQILVANTDLLIFILSKDILLSFWCLEGNFNLIQ